MSRPGSQSKWTGNKQVNTRMSNNVCSDKKGSNSPAVNLTAQQLEQLLKLLPNNNVMTDTDDELEAFSGMVSCFSTTGKSSRWIMDSGASDHMVSSLEKIVNVVPAEIGSTIYLPTGDAAAITHIGDMILSNGLKLTKVLYVPQFKHNLMSIHKLAQDNHCEVMFLENSCQIIDSESK